jgi:hypothetical protein
VQFVFFENDPYYKDQQADYNASDFVPMPIPTTHINSRHEDSVIEGEVDNLNASADEVPDAPIRPRRSGRIIQTSTRLKDFITNQVTYPIQDYLSYDKVKPDFIAFLSNLEELERKTFHEANSLPTWKKAMQNELEALETNHTWDLVPLPKGKKPV